MQVTRIVANATVDCVKRVTVTLRVKFHGPAVSSFRCFVRDISREKFYLLKMARCLLW